MFQQSQVHINLIYHFAPSYCFQGFQLIILNLRFLNLIPPFSFGRINLFYLFLGFFLSWLKWWILVAFRSPLFTQLLFGETQGARTQRSLTLIYAGSILEINFQARCWSLSWFYRLLPSAQIELLRFLEHGIISIDPCLMLCDLAILISRAHDLILES